MALRAAECQTPDLIIPDIAKPEMDGFELCRLLKQREGIQEVPVLFIKGLMEIYFVSWLPAVAPNSP